MRSLSGKPIGIFDSGVGGLTVVRSIRKCLPSEDIVYFGDTARVPYGNKSRSTIIRFSREIMGFMMAKGVKMVVVACNTASSLSLSMIKKEYEVPVIGVIEPGVDEALRISCNGRIGVIGTGSTIASGAYHKALIKKKRDCVVFSRACPLFVPLVENGFVSHRVAREVADIYLKPLRGRKIGSLILGCTHYPILKKVIADTMGGVRLVDSSVAVARYVKKRLICEGMASTREKGTTRYYVSDDPEGFARTGGIFLKERIRAVKVAI